MAIRSLLFLVVAAAVSLALVFGPLSPQRSTPAAEPASVVGSEPGVPTELATPTPSPTVAEAPTMSEQDQVLAAHVQHLASVTDGAGAAWAMSVRGSDGQLVFDSAGDELLMPASTLKSLTAALAITTFGPDHQFVTRALLDGVLTDGGTVVGDLVLEGGGDPALGSPAFDTWYPARPRTHLEDLADQVVAAGVTRVFGRVVGLDPLLTGPGLADGWKDGYLSDFDARRITGLTVDAGIRLTRNGEVSVVAGGHDDGLVGALSVDPRLAAARVFEALLAERGVTFAGPAVGDPTPDAAEQLALAARQPGDRPELGSVASPPLWRILRFMVQHSDNQLADTIGRMVGLSRTGDPTWDGLTPAYREGLAELGIEHDGLRLADGSGLSRKNVVSSSVLAEVQAVMATSEHAAIWADIQAVAGQRGTLRSWLAGTPAVGRFRGKTGTLDDVKGLAGTVWGPNGTKLHLAVVVNDAGAGRGNVRLLMDQLVLTLAAVLDGCVDLDEVTGLGAWTTGSCPVSAPVDEMIPQLTAETPTDAASIAPPQPASDEGQS